MADNCRVPKQRKLKDQPYEERLQRSLSRWPVEDPESKMHDAVTVGRLNDSQQLWLLRTHLSPAAARRLADVADAMIIGDAGRYIDVSQPERQTMWTSIERHGHLPDEALSDYLAYEPYEFDSEDGRTLLFVQRHC